MSEPPGQEKFIFWRPEVDQRGTFNILAICLSTLLICVWSAIHVDIQPKKEGSTTKLAMASKLASMFIGFFSPEILVFIAFQQRRRAGRLQNIVNTHFKLETPPQWYQFWLRSSVSIAAEEKDEEEMLNSHPPSSPGLPSVESEEDSDVDSPAMACEEPGVTPTVTLPIEENKAGRHYWTLAHAFYAVMGGYAIRDKHGKLHILKSAFIEHLLRKNPEFVPDIPKETILDRSKADGLAKAVLFTQVGWFCVSCVNRLAQSLPLTLLEVATLAHALCSMTVYILWWDKPLNIQEPLVISCPTIPSTFRRPSDTLRHSTPEHSPPDPTFSKTLLRQLRCIRPNAVFQDVLGFDMSMTTMDVDWPLLFVLVVISLVYGCPHLLAWNSAFATRTEQLLWRIASCLVISFPFCYAVGMVFMLHFRDHITNFLYLYYGGRPRPVLAAVLIACGVPFFIVYLACVFGYFICDSYIIVESLRQLFYLPPAAFVTPVWSNYLPHFY